MRETFNFWLSRNARQPGVLAGAVRYADKTLFSQSSDPRYPTSSLDLTWHTIDETLQVLQFNRLPAVRWCWTFEHGFIHFTRRADGICLGLFTTSDASLLPREQLEPMLREFEQLHPVNSA